MGNLEINLDRNSLRKTTSRLESKVDKAVESATESALDTAVDRGKTHIKNEEAVWRREVLGKTMKADFTWTELSSQEKYKIYNSAKHAGVVDKGEDFESLPNYTRLIPWVLDNLQDWNPFDDDNGNDDSVDGGGGDGLDAIASQVGTVTEDQSNEESAVNGDSIVQDREPYDASVFGIHTNGKQSNPTTDSFEIEKQLDYLDTTTIEANQFNSNYAYKALSKDQQSTLKSELDNRFGKENVQSVLDDLNEWKGGSDSASSVSFEKLVKEKYDVGADVRFVDEYDSDTPNEAQQAAYHEMGVAGREFLSRYFADDNGKLTAHRGFRDIQTAQLASQIFSNPDQNKWNYEDSVIQNYTLSETLAQGFSEGMELEITVDVDEHLVLAPDFALWNLIDNSNRDAEINVIGGQRHFGRDNLSFSGVDVTTITEGSLSLFDEKEHDAMKTIVDKMYSKESLVTDPGMSQRLTDWAKEYKSDIGDDDEIENKVDAITVDVNPPSDDSTLSFAQITGDDITTDNNPLESGDIARTEFGTFRIVDPDGITVGWQGEQEYFLQPAGGSEWDIYAIQSGEESPVHIGKTELNYARPSDNDPVFGYWTEYPDSGGEETHIYHESDAPDETVTDYSRSDTIHDDTWMEDHAGATFLVQLPDGTVVMATLYQRGSGWEFVRQDTESSYDWYPPGSDDFDSSQVQIFGIPNEAN
jgi:hypothetical protein